MKTTLINYRTYNLDKSKVTPIDRRSIFGNPFVLSKVLLDKGYTREECIHDYRKYFYNRIQNELTFQEAVLKLKGKPLGCWCTPLPCHGDIIIEYLDK